MLLFYKPKHMKPDPTIERIKHAPIWIWSEVKWYICFWVKLAINTTRKVINSGVNLIEHHDNFRDSEPFKKMFLKLKSQFENLKKILYNIYIR